MNVQVEEQEPLLFFATCSIHAEGNPAEAASREGRMFTMVVAGRDEEASGLQHGVDPTLWCSVSMMASNGGGFSCRVL